MATKAETKSIKAEIRDIKKKLTASRKTTLRAIAADRKIVRETTRRIDQATAKLGQYEHNSNRRISILEGRLSA